MLAHPLLDFDKLLFLKRSSDKYSHTYAGPLAVAMGGSLCVLSPVSPDGKVTSLVPQPGDDGPRMLDFSADIQPILDKPCVGCHSGKHVKGSPPCASTPEF